MRRQPTEHASGAVALGFVGSVIASVGRRGHARRKRPCSHSLADTNASATSSGEAAVRIGVVLLNIGTPESTTLDDVREYLIKFLGDDRVIDIASKEAKKAILQKILESAPARSAESYKNIWHPNRGSPLLYHSEDLVDGLQRILGDAYDVRIGFQYSEPSVEAAVRGLMALKVGKIILVPMFPHFAQATVGAFLANTCKVAADLSCSTYLQVVPPFYRHPGYIEAARDCIAPVVGHQACNVDHVVFSFHGIPESQCSRTDETESICMKVSDCCSSGHEAVRNCYRVQCLQTVELLVLALGLPPGSWSMAFQSRGSMRTAIRWTRPFTDELLVDIARQGKKRVAICAPSYTADCIETLGELGSECRDMFLRAGGEELFLIPCVNSSPAWTHNLAAIIQGMPESRAEASQAGATQNYWAM